MQLTYIFALIFSVIVALFAILNAQAVTVDFFFDEFQISLALVILISALAGAIILGFLGLFKQIKFGFKIRDVQHRNKKLEEQVKELEAKLADVQSSLSEKEESIKDLEGQLSRKEEVLEQLQKSLLEKERELEELRERLGEPEQDEVNEEIAEQ